MRWGVLVPVEALGPFAALALLFFPIYLAWVLLRLAYRHKLAALLVVLVVGLAAAVSVSHAQDDEATTDQATDVPTEAPAPVEVYVIAAPNSPEWSGIAAPDGRYAVQFNDGCTIEPANATAYGWGTGSITLVDHPVQVGRVVKPSETCQVAVILKMGETPCFTNAAGVCDIARD